MESLHAALIGVQMCIGFESMVSKLCHGTPYETFTVKVHRVTINWLLALIDQSDGN